MKQIVLDTEGMPSPKPGPTNVFGVFFLASSTVLLVSAICCLSFWLSAAFYLGWLPAYDHPDPKTLHWDLFYEITLFAGGTIGLLFPLWFILLIAVLVFKRIRPGVLTIVYGLVTGLLCFYLFWGSFTEWFLD